MTIPTCEWFTPAKGSNGQDSKHWKYADRLPYPSCINPAVRGASAAVRCAFAEKQLDCEVYILDPMALLAYAHVELHDGEPLALCVIRQRKGYNAQEVNQIVLIDNDALDAKNDCIDSQVHLSILTTDDCDNALEQFTDLCTLTQERQDVRTVTIVKASPNVGSPVNSYLARVIGVKSN